MTRTADLVGQRRSGRANSPQSAADRRHWLKDLNSFLLSAVCHLLVLIALGLLSVAASRSWQGIELRAQLSDGLDAPAGDELALEETAKFELVQDESSAVDPPRLFEFSAVATSDLAALESLTDLSTVSSGLDGKGLGRSGDGFGPPRGYATQFFGIGGSGASFVYVVDCSMSMNEDGKFDRARYELLRSIEHLTPEQRYFVIFYSDGAYPMDADEPVPVTADEVERMRRWVQNIRPDGGTNPLPALLMALGLQPDAIYFLSDGRFDPGTIRELRIANRSSSGRIPIHTVAFVNRETQGLMRTIARHSGGQFRFVP